MSPCCRGNRFGSCWRTIPVEKKQSWPASTLRELIMRADSRRILVVAPGSLVEQWRDELFEKFGLQFNVFSSALEAATPTGNPFEDLDLLIVRLDQMAR